MAAAPEAGSPSVGQHYGSLYVSALLKAWKQEAEAEDDAKDSASLPEEPSQLQEAAFAAFAAVVRDTLIPQLDRLADRQNITFSAQDDNWDPLTRAWRSRPGTPPISFKERWDSLPVYTATADPTVDEQDPNPSPQDHSGGPLDIEQVTNYVKHLGRLYLSTFPSSDSMAPNTRLHSQLKDLLDLPPCTRSSAPMEIKKIQGLFSHLDYRLKVCVYVTELLERAHIPLPIGLHCCEWEYDGFQRYMHNRAMEDRTDDIGARYSFVMEHSSGIIPLPEQRVQGRPFYKSLFYVACAVALSADDLEMVREKVRCLKELAERDFREQKKRVEELETFQECKHTWYRSLGKRVRGMSPGKDEGKLEGCVQN